HPTASTQLFTLSLHDALPISAQVDPPDVQVGCVALDGVEAGTRIQSDPPGVQVGCVALDRVETGAPIPDLDPEIAPTDRVILDRDRKSTRLNSSHDQISYAVF